MKKIILLLFAAVTGLSAMARTIYLVPGKWDIDGARFAVYTWDDAGSQWFDMQPAGDGCYQVEFPENNVNLIFCRMNGEVPENDWEYKWNQTADLQVPADQDCFTIAPSDPGLPWPEKEIGEWSQRVVKETLPAPGNLQAGEVTNASFVASWDAVPDAVAYHLYVETAGDTLSGYAPLATDSCQVRVEGLEMGKTYCWYVEAVGEGNYLNSERSAVDTVSTAVYYEVKISELEYATLYADTALVIPDNVKVYTGVVDNTSDMLVLTEIQGFIPKNTAVLLAATSGIYKFEGSNSETPAIGSNHLLGTLNEQSVPADSVVYTLQQNADGKVGFYPAELEILPAHTAYLQFPSAEQSTGFVLDFGTPTGIAGISQNEEVQRIYDLSGREVRCMQPARVYIVNGKKIINQ